MLYSQKRASSVVHFKMVGSCSDIYVSQLHAGMRVSRRQIYPYMYIGMNACFPAAHAAMINCLQVIVIYMFQGIMYSYICLEAES